MKNKILKFMLAAKRKFNSDPSLYMSHLLSPCKCELFFAGGTNREVGQCLGRLWFANSNTSVLTMGH